MDVPSDGAAVPVFSEDFLYGRMSKGDARFILAVADEYDRIIATLGEETVRAVLEVDDSVAVAWVSRDGVWNVGSARKSGRTHYDLRVRVDGPDDYENVPLIVGLEVPT